MLPLACDFHVVDRRGPAGASPTCRLRQGAWAADLVVDNRTGRARIAGTGVTPVRVEPLGSLREPADVAARAGDLVDEIRRELPTGRPLVIHDLACGTGAMLRWLAPRQPGPQHWITYDLDADLLAVLDAAPVTVAADGSQVTTQVRRRDVTRLRSCELAGAALITSSALLDLLTADELRRLLGACDQARCPVLITLTVTGAVQLWPPHPLDQVVANAFNAHQRRTTGGRRLLGPDAADVATRAFTELGRDVVTRVKPLAARPGNPRVDLRVARRLVGRGMPAGSASRG